MLPLSERESMITTEILKVSGLKKYFKTKRGIVKAVEGLDFEIGEGEILGLVGESGSGKTTVGNMIVGEYPPSSGEIIFKGEDLSKFRDKRPKWLRKEIQMVFQNPASSLNPRRTVRQALELPISVHRPEAPLGRTIDDLMNTVDLPSDYIERFPEELGGGEKQLVAIARALATEPSFMILDEPTSALDVSIQGKIINILIKLRRDLGLSYLFITHNMSLMSNVADRVAIMYLGKLKEETKAGEFFKNPLHPYTKLLLSSIPVLTEKEEKIKPQKTRNVGEIAGALHIPPGCSFHPRCPVVMDVCRNVDPELIMATPGHLCSCHLYSENSNSNKNQKVPTKNS